MCEFAVNPYRERSPQWDAESDRAFGDPDILNLHRSLPEYLPSPTIALPNLARALGLKQILVKDESHRLGLKAFKALGASYAVYRILRQFLEKRGDPCPAAQVFYSNEPPIAPGTFTFCTATDGNHGRGVAWVARKLRQRAVIYMPAASALARIENIRSEGAEVVVVDGSYDDAVQTAAADAKNHEWQIVSDTSWPGYDEIPRWIMAGYTTMFREIHEAPGARPIPNVILVQGGVGALAAAAAWYYTQPGIAPCPQLVSVEPSSADCLLASIRSPHGGAVQTRGRLDSIMAGLNCGTPSLVAWPFIRRGFDLFISIADRHCVRAMRSCYHPLVDDPRVVSGESGAAGLAALLALIDESSLAPARAHLNLSSGTTVLLLNTEGDTDPDSFKQIVHVTG